MCRYLTLFLVAGLALAANAALAGEPATLHVTSHPDGLRVSLNGFYKGVTPVKVVVASATETPRDYELKVEGEGFATWALTVSLKAGDHKAAMANPKRLATPAAGASLAGKIICLDPGHPSETSAGTTGKRISEIRANWLVALKLASLLEAQGAKVVLTKQSANANVTNRRRAEIANAAHANLLLRLHCDAASTRGLAVYYPDRQGTKFGVTGPARDIIARSQAAAKRFYPPVVAALKGQVPGRGIHGDSGTYIGSKQGALTGSIFSKVPVLTVEMVVLTMAADDAFIASAKGQDTMARALLAGIAAALGK